MDFVGSIWFTGGFFIGGVGGGYCYEDFTTGRLEKAFLFVYISSCFTCLSGSINNSSGFDKTCLPFGLFFLGLSFFTSDCCSNNALYLAS